MSPYFCRINWLCNNVVTEELMTNAQQQQLTPDTATLSAATYVNQLAVSRSTCHFDTLVNDHLKYIFVVTLVWTAEILLEQ